MRKNYSISYSRTGSKRILEDHHPMDDSITGIVTLLNRKELEIERLEQELEAVKLAKTDRLEETITDLRIQLLKCKKRGVKQ